MKLLSYIFGILGIVFMFIGLFLIYFKNHYFVDKSVLLYFSDGMLLTALFLITNNTQKRCKR